jgi:hypothetical protein
MSRNSRRKPPVNLPLPLQYKMHNVRKQNYDYSEDNIFKK